MFKKFAALSTAVFIVAAGLSTVAISAANAADISQTGVCITGTPSVSYSPSNIMFTPEVRSSATNQWVKSAVSWSPALVGGVFAANTVYVATVTLQDNDGGVSDFNNLGANAFTAGSCSGDAGVTITSPAVANGAHSLNLNIAITFPNTNGQTITQNSIVLTAPVAGANPSLFAHNAISDSTAQWQQIGIVTWSPNDHPFQSGVSYTATFNLNIVSGGAPLNFAALASNFFTVTGATSTTFSLGSAGPTANQVTVVFPAVGSSSSSTTTTTTTTTQSAADIAAAAAAAAAHAAAVAEAKHAAAVATARTSLTQLFAALPVVAAPTGTSTPATTASTGVTTPSVTGGATTTTAGSTSVTAPTLDQYAAADIHIASPTALVRVNNDVAALPVAKRADITAIQSIVKTENFVDVISNAATQKTVTTVDLVNQGLIDPTNPNKASVVIGLTHLDPKTLNSVANIKAAIAAQLAIVQARKDRTAAILAKTQALIAKSPASK